MVKMTLVKIPDGKNAIGKYVKWRKTTFQSKWLSEHLFLQNFPGGVSYHSRTTAITAGPLTTLLPPGLYYFLAIFTRLLFGLADYP